MQRRIRYGVIAQRNQTPPVSRLAYAAITKRVHPPSRLARWWTLFEGLFFTTVRVAVVLVAAIAALTVLSNRSQPSAGFSTDVLVGVYDNSITPNGPETLTLLADGRFTQQFLTTGDSVTGTWRISAGQLEFFQIGISDTNPKGECHVSPSFHQVDCRVDRSSVVPIRGISCPLRSPPTMEISTSAT